MFTSKFFIGGFIAINLFLGLSASLNDDWTHHFMILYKNAEKSFQQMKNGVKTVSSSLEGGYNNVKRIVKEEYQQLDTRIDDGMNKILQTDSPDANFEKLHKRRPNMNRNIMNRAIKTLNSLSYKQLDLHNINRHQ